MHRTLNRAPPAVAVAMVLAAGLGGCGGAARTAHEAGGGGVPRRLTPIEGETPGGAQLSARAPASLRQGALAQVGATQHVDASGARLAVTLRRVIDPLRASGAELPPRTRAVGVIMQIRSSGPSLYDSSATGDIRIGVSSGVVTAVLATRGICRTPLDDFDRYITAGEDRVGCVVFAVSNGATLDAVWFSPHAHRLGRLTWAP
ncbi:MAG: hypothetical protein ACRDLT_16475 [Solirubrobacteraceae bacterium]